jgi:hypothetical protein
MTRHWHVSSRSTGNGNTSCVEVAGAPGALVAVRDSRNPGRGELRFPRRAWSALLTALGPANPRNREEEGEEGETERRPRR